MITQAMSNVFKRDILLGVHQPGDTYKIALYTSAALLDAATEEYTAAGEISGTGYTAGGKVLTGFDVQLLSGAGVLSFADPLWTNASITARGALIYNASRSNKAIAVLNFGSDRTSTNGPFEVDFPSPTAAAGLIRIG